MNIFVQLASDLGEDLGPNFSVTANIGSVVPNTTTRTDLLSGMIFDVNQNATNLIISSTGTCNTQIEVPITGNTPGQECFVLKAEDWLPGMPRKVDENGSPLPFREFSLDTASCTQLTQTEPGYPPFTVTIFDNSYVFSILQQDANEETGIIYRVGSTDTGIDPESTLIVEIQDYGFGSVSITINDFKKNTVYDIIPGENSCLVKEWSIYDYVGVD